MPDRPAFHGIGFDKDGAGFLAYLPEIAYWALQADLKCGRLKFVQATFKKPHHGSGDLTSIYFSETPPGGTMNSIREYLPVFICAEDPLRAHGADHDGRPHMVRRR